ncbi:MAG: TlpA family protein disulfide reductase [Phycisphaerales bacterium]|nr:TlpA family protein disulfide reductase [Phycisphaerales bacterium]
MNRRSTSTTILAALGIVASTVLAHPQYGSRPSDGRQSPDARRLDRMNNEDRAALDAVVGYAPPAFASDLEWVGMEPTTWKDLRGKVVVIQSWTTKTSAGRSQPRRVHGILKDLPSADLLVLGLHTPEGADGAKAFLERAPLEIPTVIDPSGTFCDELGVYKRPVNLVIDRNGTLRYAGLNTNGLKQTVEELLAEKADPAAEPKARPAPEATANSAGFPNPTGSVRSARDQRGKPMPTFVVDRWLTNADDPRGRLLLLDFWATWCGPCMAAVPHMNEIATRLSRDVCVVGITDETKGAVDQGLMKKGKKINDFSYALASDPQARLKNYFGITGIPHCVIVSADGVVRWQGHPMELTEAVIGPMISANRALQGNAAGGGGGRWKRG